jgi:hypothetical protein
MAHPKKKPVARAFNFRKIPESIFFKIKMAAAAEHQTTRDWLLALAIARIAELEHLGKLPENT